MSNSEVELNAWKKALSETTGYSQLTHIIAYIEDLEKRLEKLENPETKNQCDGCARDLPINEHGIHYNPDGSYDHIACTKDKY